MVGLGEVGRGGRSSQTRRKPVSGPVASGKQAFRRVCIIESYFQIVAFKGSVGE
jgi:hypothetical protein